MLILALDTSSAGGSAALARDGALLIERVGDETRTHGERLPTELMQILDAAGVPIHDVDRLAIATGPGSFTGLRVGIATVQGLALARRTLVTPVSSFDAHAFVCTRGATEARRVAVWIDAHRGEVFASLYDADGRRVLQPPSSLAPSATLDAWRTDIDDERPIVFAGDGALKYADEIRARLGARAILPRTVPPIAGAIAAIANAEPDRAVTPHAVVPLYVRRPDAELARDRRLAER